MLIGDVGISARITCSLAAVFQLTHVSIPTISGECVCVCVAFFSPPVGKCVRIALFSRILRYLRYILPVCEALPKHFPDADNVPNAMKWQPHTIRSTKTGPMLHSSQCVCAEPDSFMPKMIFGFGFPLTLTQFASTHTQCLGLWHYRVHTPSQPCPDTRPSLNEFIYGRVNSLLPSNCIRFREESMAIGGRE